MLISFFDDLEVETDFPSYFYKGLYEGKNKLALSTVTELKKFDDEWIKTIETYIPSIDKIVRNLKSTLRYDEEVVIIEKAKKTDSQTVRHLAANAQYLKRNDNPKTNSDLPVTPQKLLIKQSEIEYGIYENRFIMTLILKLASFVNERVKILKQDINTKKHTTFKHHIEIDFDDIKYDVDFNINELEEIPGGKVSDYNLTLLDRAEHLNRQIGNLSTSHFMKMMRGYKPVRSPIMKTQIILKNTDYRNCYNLWQFLEQYSNLGYEVIRNEKKRRFDETYRKHLNQNALMALSTIFYHDPDRSKDEVLASKRYKSRKAELISVTPDNIVLDPKAYEIEDSRINEYYINKAKQNFKSLIDYHMESEPKYEVALRKAIKETLEITNVLFESYFGINADKDVFNYLIDDAGKEEQFKQSENKYEIASLVRELKEKDIRSAVTLEKKWYQETLKFQKRYIKEKEFDELKKVQKEVESVKLSHDELLKQVRDEELDKLRLQLKKQSKQMETLKKQYQELYKKEESRINRKIAEKKQQEKLRLKALKEKEEQKLKIKIEKEKELLRMKALRQKEKLKRDHQKKVAKLKEKL